MEVTLRGVGDEFFAAAVSTVFIGRNVESLAPKGKSRTAVATTIVYIASMEVERGTYLVAGSMFEGLVNINTRLLIATVLVENPSIGVEISSVLRFGIYRLPTHSFSLVEITSFKAEKISVIVEAKKDVWIEISRLSIK